jgi:hypothetical protein
MRPPETAQHYARLRIPSNADCGISRWRDAARPLVELAHNCVAMGRRFEIIHDRRARMARDATRIIGPLQDVA